MREFQERRRLRKFLHSRYAIAILAVALLLVARGVWGIYGKYERSKEISAKANKDLATLEERQKALSRSMEALETSEGRERDKFGAVKEGERLIVLVDENASDPVVPIKKKGFWASLFGF
jgi:cell division protein FtsB